ncbi:MAG: FAD-binding oxidoreductase [Flavobacteriaceae bacterium]|nr:FAD-binding oxidoreductase [Flavobacteriaceae bacterium]
MNLSYWEKKSWFSNIDFTIVGSGIVGLSCALYLKSKYQKANILILEKGILPQGASTKNAGFACFGSLSELSEDLKSTSEQEVYDLVQKRWNGLQYLRQNLGDRNIDYRQHGGYELFVNEEVYNDCVLKNDAINKLLQPVFGKEVFSFKKNILGFKNIMNDYSYNDFEGQLDTGKMMGQLLQKVQAMGVKIVNNIEVKRFIDLNKEVSVKTTINEFNTNKLVLATNGFANQLIDENIRPARAQVLITKPIKNLQIKGNFHLDRGYYYFRNIDSRILLGGGRNLAFKEEETMEFAQTSLIQNKLKELLKNTILPDVDFEIDSSWSGIMGVGDQKKAIVKQLNNNVFCGVRLGGMGVAIGSAIGKELAELM